jgi:hypothetical protein
MLEPEAGWQGMPAVCVSVCDQHKRLLVHLPQVRDEFLLSSILLKLPWGL